MVWSSIEEKEVRIRQVPKGKVSFLRSLGVHTEASTLVKIRQFFKQTDQEEITQKQLNSLLNNENELLQNTILWLQSEGTLIPSDDLRLFWFVNCIIPCRVFQIIHHYHTSKILSEH